METVRRISIVALLFALQFEQSSLCFAVDDLPQIIRLHSTYVDRIHSVQLAIKVEYFYQSQKQGDYRITWGLTPTKEVYHIEQSTGQVSGEFSGLVFSTGNRSFYNGPEGYRALQNFDGQLVDGVLPPDSPCTARIAGRQQRIRAEDPWTMLLIQFQTDDHVSPIPLVDFLKEASSVRQTSFNVVLMESERYSYEFVFDPTRNGLVQEFKRRNLGVVDFHAVVESFTAVSEFGPFPTRIRATLGSGNDETLTIIRSVEECKINRSVSVELIKLELPNEVPLFDAMTGQLGFWSDGRPHYFNSEAEAIDWQKEKRQRIGTTTHSSDRRSHWVLFGFVAIFVMLFAIGLWRRNG